MHTAYSVSCNWGLMYLYCQLENRLHIILMLVCSLVNLNGGKQISALSILTKFLKVLKSSIIPSSQTDNFFFSVFSLFQLHDLNKMMLLDTIGILHLCVAEYPLLYLYLSTDRKWEAQHICTQVLVYATHLLRIVLKSYRKQTWYKRFKYVFAINYF